MQSGDNNDDNSPPHSSEFELLNAHVDAFINVLVAAQKASNLAGSAVTDKIVVLSQFSDKLAKFNLEARALAGVSADDINRLQAKLSEIDSNIRQVATDLAKEFSAAASQFLIEIKALTSAQLEKPVAGNKALNDNQKFLAAASSLILLGVGANVVDLHAQLRANQDMLEAKVQPLSPEDKEDVKEKDLVNDTELTFNAMKLYFADSKIQIADKIKELGKYYNILARLKNDAATVEGTIKQRIDGEIISITKELEAIKASLADALEKYSKEVFTPRVAELVPQFSDASISHDLFINDVENLRAIYKAALENLVNLNQYPSFPQPDSQDIVTPERLLTIKRIYDYSENALAILGITATARQIFKDIERLNTDIIGYNFELDNPANNTSFAAKALLIIEHLTTKNDLVTELNQNRQAYIMTLGVDYDATTNSRITQTLANANGMFEMNGTKLITQMVAARTALANQVTQLINTNTPVPSDVSDKLKDLVAAATHLKLPNLLQELTQIQATLAAPQASAARPRRGSFVKGGVGDDAGPENDNDEKKGDENKPDKAKKPDDQKKPEDAKKPDDEKPDDEKKPDELPKPKAQPRKRSSNLDIAEVPQNLIENSLAKILYDGLTAADPKVRRTAFQSLLNFAKSVDQQAQIQFFISLFPKLELHIHPASPLDEYLADNLPDIIKLLKQDPEAKTEEGKKNQEEFKKLRNKIFSELENVANHNKYPIPEHDYKQPEPWITIIQNLSTPLLNELTNKPHIGNIFNAVVPHLGRDHDGNKVTVTNVALRDAFEKQGIEHARWFGEKEGGANLAGNEGGLYRHVYQDANGVLQFPIVFYKEPTDLVNPDDKKKKTKNPPTVINYQEGIAEVVGGRMMNKLFGDISAPLYATPIMKPDGSRTEHVYIASVYHKKFTDLHHLAYEWLDFHKDKEFTKRKSKWESWGLWEDSKVAYRAMFLGDGKYKHYIKGPKDSDGQLSFEVDKKILRESLGTAVMSAIFVGNYQIHTENLGIGMVKDKDGNEDMRVVSLDYGGAMRPDYITHLTLTSELIDTYPDPAGRFEREVRPLDSKGKKYGISYLAKHFDKDIRLSKEFIDGAEVVANKTNAEIIDTVQAEVRAGVEKYGAGVFYDHFASLLDKSITSRFKMPLFAGREPTAGEKAAIITITTEYLQDVLLARRVSTKEFVLELRIEAAKDQIKDKKLLNKTLIELAKQNPFYALRHPKEFKNVASQIKSTTLAKLNAEAPGGAVLGIMINELNILEHIPSAGGIRLILSLVKHRLNIAIQGLQEKANDKDVVEFATKDQLLKELVALESQLSYAFLAPGYRSEMDHNIMALLADEAFQGMKKLFAAVPAANLQSFIDRQIDITPKNSDQANDKNPRLISTSKAASEYWRSISKTMPSRLTGGVQSRPLPSPSPSPTPPVAPHSASGRPRPLVPGSKTDSPSTYGIFTKRVQKSFTDFLTDFVLKIAHTFDKDKVARDALKTFVGSSIGQQELANPNNTVLQRIHNQIKTHKLSRVTLPENILRTEIMNQAEFEAKFDFSSDAEMKPLNVADLAARQAPSLTDTPPPDHNLYAMNYVKTPAVADAKTTQGWASFLEERVDNVYSIKAISLPPEVSRTSLLESHLPDSTPAMIQTLREQLRTIEIDAFKLPNQTDQLNALSVKMTSLLKTTGLDDTKAQAFMDAYRSNCLQVVAGNKLIAAPGYLAYVQGQMQKFIAEAGSNKTVRITPTNDPLLAQAYILICKANNLKYNNQSGFEFTEVVNDPKILEHINKNYPVDAAKTLTAVKELVHEIDTRLAKISAPVDDPSLTDALTHFKDEIKAFKTKVDKGEYISSKDLYKLIDNISATTTVHEEKFTERPEAGRRGSF